MGAQTNFAENKIIDAKYRGLTVTWPTTIYLGLIVATRGYSSNVRSAVVSVGDTVIPTTPNGRFYKCTTGGTCGAGEPSWSTSDGGTTTDGTAVWTEQTVQMEAGTFTEATGGSYARAGLACSTTNWAATNGAGSTANPSTGTSGQTSNNVAITFPSPTANWGLVWGVMECDASSGGNVWSYGALTTPKTVNNGDPAPSYAISAYGFTLDA